MKMGHPAVFARGRRQFLRGVGGAVLALPVLPSLLSGQQAKAQMANPQRCLAYLLLAHGGCSQKAMFPSEAMLTETRSYAGRSIRRGALQTTVSNGEARISEVLRAPSGQLTPALISKMNVLRGIDTPFYIGHGQGPALGNFSDTVGGDSNSHFFPTIDQVLAWAPSFYGNAANIRERVISLGGSTWAYSNPNSQSGSLIRVTDSAPSNVALFDKLFGTTTLPPVTSGAPAPLLVDKVFESYKRVRASGRLSTVDAQRLDDHMQRLTELQRRLTASPVMPPSTSRPTMSTEMLRLSDDFEINPAKHGEVWNLWADIVAAAFSVGASRLFTGFVNESFSSDPRPWHDVVHTAQITSGTDSPLGLITSSNSRFFQNAVLELARKLEAVADASGGTLLDRSLVAWSHESGSPSHNGTGGSIVTFGSAHGAIRTGQYCDYRDLTRQNVLAGGADNMPIPGETSYFGLTLNQWLGTVLQSMGLAKSEYKGLNGGAGYPAARTFELAPANGYPNEVWSVAGEMLPWLGA